MRLDPDYAKMTSAEREIYDKCFFLANKYFNNDKRLSVFTDIMAEIRLAVRERNEVGFDGEGG